MIYACLGKREVGKTTLGIYLIRTCDVQVVFDPRGLYPSTTPRITNGVQLSKKFDQLYDRDPPRDLFVVTPENDVTALCDRVARECKSWVRESTGTTGLLLDEFRFIKQPEKISALDWLLRCATRAQVTVVFTAHRPVDIPADFRSIVDVWCLFQATNPRDLDIIGDYVDDRTLALIPRLEPRHFIAWDDTRAVASIYRDPALWFSPLTITAQPSSSALGAGEPTRRGDLFS